MDKLPQLHAILDEIVNGVSRMDWRTKRDTVLRSMDKDQRRTFEEFISWFEPQA